MPKMSLIRKVGCFSVDDIFCGEILMKLSSFDRSTPFFDLALTVVFLRIRLIEETLGTDSRGQTPSIRSFSRISHAKSEQFLSLYSRILAMTTGVDTRGLLPPTKMIRLLPFFNSFENLTKSHLLTYGSRKN